MKEINKTVSEMVSVPVEELVPYSNNPRKHSQKQINSLRKSLQEFGFVNPLIIDRNYNVIAGHGRLEAAQAEGYSEVPCVFVEDMTEEQKRAYIIADNQHALNADWDYSLLSVEMEDLRNASFDLSTLGFDFLDNGDSFFENSDLRDDMSQSNEEYNEFLDKFVPKKTTDDCYTPENIYQVIADWVAKEYGLSKDNFVRPFYPGGDYQRYKYKKEDVVVDNPPFSILAEIKAFYCEKDIKFFLFAPRNTIFTANANVTAIIAASGITYENGAEVQTSFVTNLEDPNIVARTCPELYHIIKEQNDINVQASKRTIPKYEYPVNVCTAAMMAYMVNHDVEYLLKRDECVFIRELDAQKAAGKGIFGSGYLLSEKAAAEKAAAEKAAAEKAAAEKAAAEKWELSDREKKIIAKLSK